MTRSCSSGIHSWKVGPNEVAEVHVAGWDKTARPQA